MQLLAAGIRTVADDGGAEPPEVLARALEPLVLRHEPLEQVSYQAGDGGILLGGSDSSPAGDLFVERDRHVSQASHDTILVLHEYSVNSTAVAGDRDEPGRSCLIELMRLGRAPDPLVMHAALAAIAAEHGATIHATARDLARLPGSQVDRPAGPALTAGHPGVVTRVACQKPETGREPGPRSSGAATGTGVGPPTPLR
jgi:hypothetical protein